MKNDLLLYLQNNAAGRSNAKTSDQIFNYLTSLGHVIDSGRTQEEVRGLIRELVEENNELIGSSNTGYFLIDTQQDAQHTVDNLRNRASEINERANNIRDNWNSQNPTQQIT